MKNNFSIHLLLFLLLISFNAFSQDKFTIKLITQKHDIKLKSNVTLPRATVTLLKDEKNSLVKKSDEKGELEFVNLEYNHIYKLVFSMKGCIQMYMLVDANVPDGCRGEGFETNCLFYEVKDKDIDSTNFIYPFIKAGCINNKKFKIDEKYTDDFMKGIIPPDMIAAHEKEMTEKKNKEKQEAEKLAAELKAKKEKEIAETIALEAKKIKIAGKLFTGENPSKPVSNVVLKLVDEKGVEVQTITTNFLGAFVFYILPYNNYDFKGEENVKVLPNAKVVFTNKNDNEIQIADANAKGAFKFKLLANDAKLLELIKVEDADLKMDLKGRLLSGDGPVNKPLIEVKINLIGPVSEPMQTTKTDKDGQFSFTYLSSTENYKIAIDESNTQLASIKKIILTNEKGEVIKEGAGNKLGDFKFELLPNEKSKMAAMYVDDPWLKIINLPAYANAKAYEQIITERVYFNVNEDKLLPDAKKTLDKIISVLTVNTYILLELSSHTDSQGGDDYNLKLSERRAKATVDYMVASGLSANRVSGKGYGETHLLNKCANNVKCAEEEHAKNRRLEFKVIKK